MLLEYFDEPQVEGERCGHCDNCVAPKVAPQDQPAAQIEVPEAMAAPLSPFKAGDEVRVPRYGGGRVEQVAGEEVTVVFPDGSSRAFAAGYVQVA